MAFFVDAEKRKAKQQNEILLEVLKNNMKKFLIYFFDL